MTDTTTAAPAPAPDAEAAPAAPGSEEAELIALHQHDPMTFEYTPNWKGTDKTGAQRLYELQKERTATEQAEAQTDASDEGSDADAIDLDAPAADADGDEEAEEGEAGEQEVDLQWDREDFTWTPPEGAEVTPIGQERIDQFAEFAHRANMPPEAFEGAINFYNDLVAKEQERLVEADKTSRTELTKALKSDLVDNFRAFSAELESSFKVLDPDLQAALKTARLPSGQSLMPRPDVVRLIHSLGAKSVAG